MDLRLKIELTWASFDPKHNKGQDFALRRAPA